MNMQMESEIVGNQTFLSFFIFFINGFIHFPGGF